MAENLDFNWDALGKTGDIYSAAERAKLEQLYDGTFSAVNENEVILGKVVSITEIFQI
jgi:small subunit ribosomal protein S1